MTTRHVRLRTGRRYLGAAVILGVAVALALVAPTAANAGKGGGGLTNSPVYKVDKTVTGDHCPEAPSGIPANSVEGTFEHIQAAVDCAEAAGGGFTIRVGPGTYYENLVLGALAFTEWQPDPETEPEPGHPSSLTIVSTGGAGVTIIDGGSNGPAVTSGLFDPAIYCAVGTCWQVTATIRGFTIQHGNGFARTAQNIDEIIGDTVVAGGGVFNGPGSNLTLVNDVVKDNDVTGIIDPEADPETTTPYFGIGGGIFNDAFAKLTLSATTVRGNVADAGGGIADAPLWGECPMHYCFSGDVHVQSSSLVTGNTASEYGGGFMLTTHGSISVSSSTVSYNEAGPASGQWTFPWPSGIGGAIASVPSIWHDPFSPGGQVSLSGANVTYNTATAGGGAIVNLGGQLTASGGTMANNEATAGPGGALLNIYEGSAYIGTPNINANRAGTVGGGIANCQNATLNLSGGKIQANTADAPAPAGGGLGFDTTSPWSAVNTAIRGNWPDQKATVDCDIHIVLPLD
jgi:hypothetical protein